MFSRCTHARAATSCVSISDGKLTVIDSSGADQRRQANGLRRVTTIIAFRAPKPRFRQVAWSSDPQSQRLPQLLPLRGPQHLQRRVASSNLKRTFFQLFPPPLCSAGVNRCAFRTVPLVVLLSLRARRVSIEVNSY